MADSSDTLFEAETRPGRTSLDFPETPDARYCIRISSPFGEDTRCVRTAAPDQIERANEALREIETRFGQENLFAPEAVAALYETGFGADAFELLTFLMLEYPDDQDLVDLWVGLLLDAYPQTPPERWLR